MKILNILPAYTTPLQRIGLYLYIGSIITMFFIERESLYYGIRFSKLFATLFVFITGITLFSFDTDVNKSELISTETGIVMVAIGITIMIAPLIVVIVIETIKDKKKRKKNF